MLKKTLVYMVAIFLLFGCSKPEGVNVSVTFKSNGGNDIPMQTLTSGSLIKEATPVDKGFVFAGWFYDEDFLLPFYYNNAINKDITLYANWKPSVLNASFTLYTPNTNEIIGFAHNMLFDDSGILFLSTGDGIYKINTSGTVSSFVKGKYWGLSFDSKGNLFALKPENTLSNIDKIDVSGNSTPFLKVDFFASCLFFDKRNGDLYLGDWSRGSIKKIDLLGNISEFTTGYKTIQDFTIDTFGVYYIASYSSIGKINSKGVHSWLASNLNSPPMLIICDSKGNLYTSNIDGTICKITPSGAVVYFKASNSSETLRCMTIGKDGNLYVTLSTSNLNYVYVNNIYKITF